MTTNNSHESSTGNDSEEMIGHQDPYELFTRVEEVRTRLESVGIETPDFRQIPQLLDKARRGEGAVYRSAAMHTQLYRNRFMDEIDVVNDGLNDRENRFFGPVNAARELLINDLDADSLGPSRYRSGVDTHVDAVRVIMTEMLEEKAAHFNDEVTVDKVVADFGSNIMAGVSDFIDEAESVLDSLNSSEEQPATRLSRFLSKIAIGQPATETAVRDELEQLVATSASLLDVDSGVYEATRIRAVDTICELFGVDVVSSPAVFESATINDDWYQQSTVPSDLQSRVGPVRPSVWLNKQVIGIMDGYIEGNEDWTKFKQHINDLNQERLEQQRQRAKEDARRTSRRRRSRAARERPGSTLGRSQVERDIAKIVPSVRGLQSGFETNVSTMLKAFHSDKGSLPKSATELIRYAVTVLHPDRHADTDSERDEHHKAWVQLHNYTKNNS